MERARRAGMRLKKLALELWACDWRLVFGDILGPSKLAASSGRAASEAHKHPQPTHSAQMADTTTEIKASDDAAALMTKTETYVLTKAIGLVEGARLVDKNVLSSLGLGLADCDRLRDIAGSALGPMREKYAEALVSADPNLWGLGVMEGNDDDEVKRVALLTVARMVAAIVDETLKPTADLKGTSAGGLTSYVVTQTEEERSFTLSTWDNVDTSKGRAVHRARPPS